MKFFSKERCLCIVLNDDYFKDLFDDLILSIYNKIFNISDIEEYSELFIKHFFKWSSFFINKKNDGLTKDDVKGLIGELIYLKNLLIDTTLNVDDVLLSWRGPYDDGHDFVFDFTDFEIKTIEKTKNNVRISSEFQLDSEKGKKIELVVISVEFDIDNGISLKSITNEIKSLVLDKFGDISIFITALSQKGLIVGDLERYDIYRFTPVLETTYDSSNDTFPKLIKSQLPEQINKLKYNIRLNLIEEFIIDKKNY